MASALHDRFRARTPNSSCGCLGSEKWYPRKKRRPRMLGTSRSSSNITPNFMQQEPESKIRGTMRSTSATSNDSSSGDGKHVVLDVEMTPVTTAKSDDDAALATSTLSPLPTSSPNPDDTPPPSTAPSERGTPRQPSYTINERYWRQNIAATTTALPSFLDHAIATCAASAVGLLGLEVWRFSTTSGNLVPGKPQPLHVFRIPEEADEQGSRRADEDAVEAFVRLTQELRAAPTGAGVGLQGALWGCGYITSGEQLEPGGESSTRSTSSGRGKRERAKAKLRRKSSVEGITMGSRMRSPQSEKDLLWRNVGDIANDPDQVRPSLI